MLVERIRRRTGHLMSRGRPAAAGRFPDLQSRAAGHARRCPGDKRVWELTPVAAGDGRKIDPLDEVNLEVLRDATQCRLVATALAHAERDRLDACVLRAHAVGVHLDSTPSTHDSPDAVGVREGSC